MITCPYPWDFFVLLVRILLKFPALTGFAGLARFLESSCSFLHGHLSVYAVSLRNLWVVAALLYHGNGRAVVVF
jgi:hypothetical protein